MQEFDRFIKVVGEIREKCPWDSVQTHESLKKYLVEESQEVLDGIDRLNETGDSDNLCEELGDVLLLPCNLLRSGEEVFLDDVTLSELENALQVPIHIVKSDGQCLYEELLGHNLNVE